MGSGTTYRPTMDATTSKLVWHYTYSGWIEKILESRVILPPALIQGYVDGLGFSAATGCPNKGYECDKKIVYFSANQVWEPASFRGFRDEFGGIIDVHDPDDYVRYGSKIYRIGVSPSILKPWVRLKSQVRMPREMAKSLEATARRLGSNPYDWWGTVQPVPREKWQALEIFVGGDEWLGIDAEILKGAGHCERFGAGRR